jgi:hypothetical protein
MRGDVVVLFTALAVFACATAAAVLVAWGLWKAGGDQG